MNDQVIFGWFLSLGCLSIIQAEKVVHLGMKNQIATLKIENVVKSWISGYQCVHASYNSQYS